MQSDLDTATKRSLYCSGKLTFSPGTQAQRQFQLLLLSSACLRPCIQVFAIYLHFLTLYRQNKFNTTSKTNFCFSSGPERVCVLMDLKLKSQGKGLFKSRNVTITKINWNLSQTSPCFACVLYKSFENTEGKGEIARVARVICSTLGSSECGSKGEVKGVCVCVCVCVCVLFSPFLHGTLANQAYSISI